jgi:stage IV sporulation protein FB
MSLFQPPAPTTYDLSFRIFGISVRIHPFFWLIAILFGTSSGSVAGLLSWVIVLFISILIHELGHSMAMRFYGQDSYVVLHGMGGLAIPIESYAYNATGPRTSWDRIIISLAGPFAGFLLALLIAVGVKAAGGVIFYNWLLGFFPMPVAFPPFRFNTYTLINDFLWVNIFWGLINMLPVFPLDGGRVSRELFILMGRRNTVANSLWLSVITGAVIAVAAMIYLESFYMAFLFGYLAFQSYQALQRGGF